MLSLRLLLPLLQLPGRLQLLFILLTRMFTTERATDFTHVTTISVTTISTTITNASANVIFTTIIAIMIPNNAYTPSTPITTASTFATMSPSYHNYY
jgi:hypothetical protein